MRWRSVLAAAAAVVVLAAPAHAQTVEDALKVVPKDALGFAIVNKLSEASDRIVEVTERLQVPLPEGAPLPALKKKLGIEKGLNDNGAALLVLLPGKTIKAEPIALAYVPVGDYQELLKELKAKGTDTEITEFTPPKGEALVVTKKDAFAVVCKAKDKAALEKALASGGGAASVAALHKWLTGNQVSGVLTHKGVKVLAVLAREGLKKARDDLANAPNPDVGEMFGDYLKGLADFFKAAESDVRGAAVGLRVDKAGDIRLTSRAVFAKGSGFAKAAADFQAPEGGPLAGLPARPFALALGGALPEEAVQRLMQLSMQMMKVGLKDAPDEAKKKLQEAYAEVGKGIRGMGFLFAVPREGEPVFSAVFGLIHVENAKDYLKRTEKSTKLVAEAMKGLNLPFAMPMTVKRVKVGGREALETTTDLSNLPGGGAAGQILEPLFGSADKITQTAVAVDDHTIIGTYTTPEKTEKLLAAAKAKGGLEAMPGVVKVSSRLPKGSQWVGFVDPHGGMEVVKRALAAIPFIPAPQMPEMGKTPPIGLGLKLTAAGVEGEVIVPAATIQAIARFARDVQKMKKDQDQ
jgi:hypothetical protein